MPYEIARHKIAYLILMAGLVVAVLSFLAAWPNSLIQRMIVLGMVLFYFVWGIVTHLQTHSLNRRIIEEYGAVALLAGALLLIITF